MRKTKAMAAGGWLMALLVALLPVAGAQSQEVQLWKSATSGITYKLTIGVHRIGASISGSTYGCAADRGIERAHARDADGGGNQCDIGFCGIGIGYRPRTGQLAWSDA